jgi:hypothetical protein
MSRPHKQSHPLANLANTIEVYVACAWPAIAQAVPTNIWFTGSHIWYFLYPDLYLPLLQRDPPLIRDWDIFTIGAAPAQWLVELHGWNLTPSCRTTEKWTAPRIIETSNIPKTPGSVSMSGYGDGYSYKTDRGIVDLWISEFESPLAEIREYPTESHAHCRVAWSFTDGLIVLPNERACESGSGDSATKDTPP